MTYREKIIMTNPSAISPLCDGGVKGCPGSHFENAPHYLRDDCHSFGDACKICWDRTIPETEEKEHTSFQEDMMAVLGNMTKPQAKFAIEWLWNKYFKEEKR